jgi:transposase
MLETAISINQTLCDVVVLNYSLPVDRCDRCPGVELPFTTAKRTAIDLHLDHPVLLSITVSVHYCPACHHYFRTQPPFLRRDAIYTRQVVSKAVQSVYEDGMALRRVAARLARDFWVRPSEGMIRAWCRSYGARFDFAADYQPWVVSEFSGILCVDELYQDRLALLLAVDPAAPDGDRLVGYQLVHGSIDAPEVARFLTRLKAGGIEPDEVITDGSQLYPTVLAQVWPQAAHQLCLFHETRRVTTAVMKVIQAIRNALPQPRPAVGSRGGGPLRSQPPSDNPADPATQRWYGRQEQRRTQLAQVHALAQQGFSQRAIARQTGHHRHTIRRWLQQPIPDAPTATPVELAAHAALPLPRQRPVIKAQRLQQVHHLAQQGYSYSAIARQVGLHRVTVKQWLQQEPPPGEGGNLTFPEPVAESLPPPAPWSTWDEVRQVREALQEHRFLFLHRPEHLAPDEQAHIAALLASPIGPQLQVARTFLIDWYRLWRDEAGQRPPFVDAQARFEAWRTNPTYQAVPHLRRLQEQMTPIKFQRLSQFLRHSHWEATNNGVERAGRTFRHRQAPHFNFRSADAIENAITVAAFQQKAAALGLTPSPANASTRGRKPRHRAV